MRALCTTLLAASLFATAVPMATADDAAPTEDAAATEAPAKDWTEHKGDLPFIVGYAAGMKEVEFTGKPPMLFFTTTW